MENKPNPVDFTPPNSIAAIWSMMLPGLGQLLKGRPLAGILWAIFSGSGYFTYFWPGLVIHLLCILDAAFVDGNKTLIKVDTWPKKIGFLILVFLLIAYTIIRNDLI
ncbi:MAG TPA: hypothetical protein VKY27_05880 [Bacteriovoracaceae bacterium]|nr:hypothetical protein [Bacteriovoracaceae bacterium]